MQNPFTKLSLRDLINYLDSSRQNDVRYSKRGDKSDPGIANDLDGSYDASRDSELVLKNLDAMWQTMEDQLSEFFTKNY